MPAGGNAAWLARHHDLKAFLSALYIEAAQSENPGLRPLRPMLGKVLAGL